MSIIDVLQEERIVLDPHLRHGDDCCEVRLVVRLREERGAEGVKAATGADGGCVRAEKDGGFAGPAQEVEELKDVLAIAGKFLARGCHGSMTARLEETLRFVLQELTLDARFSFLDIAPAIVTDRDIFEPKPGAQDYAAVGAEVEYVA